MLFNGIWRVCGVLGVSRAIGDRIFKPNIVTCQPEVSASIAVRWTRFVLGRVPLTELHSCSTPPTHVAAGLYVHNREW